MCPKLGMSSSQALLESKYLLKDINFLSIETDHPHYKTIKEFSNDKVLLLNFFYKNCKGSCNPFIVSLKETLNKLNLSLNDFEILSLSFEDHDSFSELVKYKNALGLFWWIGKVNLDDLTPFGYEVSPLDVPSQYDHPSILFAVEKGKVKRALFGNTISEKKLRNFINELRGFYNPIIENEDSNILFRCVDYNPDTGKPEFNFGMLLLFVPGFFAYFLAFIIFKR